MATPLDGIRVLDFTRVLSGPHATRMLVDLGAEVIKVEPPGGDLTRFSAPRRNGMATYFAQQNAGKRNVSIDLARPEGAGLARRLADHCDVVVENYRPGVMARLGLAYDTLAARNERLVYASISGYGQTGPWVHRRAYAAVVGAESGLTKAQGDARGGHHLNDPQSHADVYTSLEAASAILAALFQRARTGRGQWIDVSMAETMLYVNEHLHDQLYDGPVDPGTIRSFGTGEYLVVTVASGEQAVISGHPAERGTFDLLTSALGVPQLALDPRFADRSARLDHLGELRDVLLTAAATLPDAATLEGRCAEHRLAVGVLRTARELADTEWAAARGAIVEVPDRAGGTIRIPNAPWRFSAAETGAGGEPRFRGEDNRAVLRELLGVDDDAVDRLEADGILSSRTPSSRRGAG